jgi:hypothetical protein
MTGGRNIIRKFNQPMNMKALKTAILAGSLLLAVVDIPACGSAAAGDPVKGFAVVELFTSEGCSSCPPADQLMARIQQDSKGQPVYILAFHVDYWNRLGWKDVFSDASYTQRQNQYAAWLRLQSVYTPQVVVNGSKEFVGSQEATLRTAISNGLQEASPAQLTLGDITLDNGKVALRYQAKNAGHHTSLLIAIVQRSATSQVKAGENTGRTLSHVQIVRQLQTVKVDANSNGAGFLPLPAGVNTSDEEIIAFLQDDNNGHIIAATRSPLP